MELITHSMAQLVATENPARNKPSLRPRDAEKVRYAREIVAGNFQTPPRLIDLARTVGLPHTRLNLYFRQMFGTTIFGYLRQIRLNNAKQLFDEGHKNVTEVAYDVGYASLSHFAKAFRGHFGISPRDYLHETSRKWL